MLKNLINKFINLLYPHKCLICKSKGEIFCNKCQNLIKPIHYDHCDICLYPLQNICYECYIRKPFFKKLISVGIYDDPLKKLIHIFKYHNKLELGEIFAQLMLNEWLKHNIKVDYILAVPMHEDKLKKRKYNHTEILLKNININLNYPILNNVIRTKNTKPQYGLSRNDRFLNVQNAFDIKRDRESIKNKTILIIDDIFTSGATVNEICKLLKNNCAKDVYVLTLARGVCCKNN